jgi:hypothetical protein
MLDLDSPRWETLRVPLGNAHRVPSLIREFQKNPNVDGFDMFWDELTGEGDLAIYDAFFCSSAARRIHDPPAPW